MEKPVASDVTGVRRVLASAKKAKEKGLTVGIGLQRRHEERYIDCVKQLQDGAIGDINMLRVYWNGNSIWHRAKQQGMTKWNIRLTIGITLLGHPVIKFVNSIFTTLMRVAGLKACIPSKLMVWAEVK